MVVVSQATLALGSCARILSKIASEIWSQILTGCPYVTDSEVKNRFAILFLLCCSWVRVFVRQAIKKARQGRKFRYRLIFRHTFDGGIGTATKNCRLPGVTGPCPSTTLDKSRTGLFYQSYPQMSISFPYVFLPKRKRTCFRPFFRISTHDFSRLLWRFSRFSSRFWRLAARF